VKYREKKHRITVAIGLSGGVDSSVASDMLLGAEFPSPHGDLKESELNIIGVSHYIWPSSACCTEETIDRARCLCEERGIPFYVIPMVEEFSNTVVNDFIRSYLHGETPNPCVRCNQHVRFDSFYRKVEKLLRAEGHLYPEGPLYFSTGHYVRTEKKAGKWFLKRALDRRKDQSYMLYRIPQGLLPYCIFPLGDFRKTEIIERAKRKALPSSSVRESQDACFVDNDYPRFIQERVGQHLGFQSGPIVDSQGIILGEHKGYIHYTVGQRRGLDLGNGPWYVSEVRPKTNTVVVGRREELEHNELRIHQAHWFDLPKEGEKLNVALRYNAPELSCSLKFPAQKARQEGGTARVLLDTPSVVTPGQSAVFYRDNVLLGGGIIGPLLHD